MKTIKTLLFLLIALVQTHAQDPTLKIEFTTIHMDGFSHDKHVLAVWLETDAGEFVKTPLVYADERKSDLYTWNAEPANGNELDAITGATQLEHKIYTIIWNCQDLKGSLIPNGNYILHLEMNNNHSQGPLSEIDFTIEEDSFSLNPDDEAFFKDISLVYDPDISEPDINTLNEEYKHEKEILSIFPNPANDVVNFSLNLNRDELVTLRVYDSKFQLVKELANKKSFFAGENTITWNIENKTPSGTYFMLISTKDHVYFGKQIVINRL